MYIYMTYLFVCTHYCMCVRLYEVFVCAHDYMSVHLYDVCVHIITHVYICMKYMCVHAHDYMCAHLHEEETRGQPQVLFLGTIIVDFETGSLIGTWGS